MKVPRWLPEHLKADFRALAKELLAADMGAAQLDRDTVGRYLVAQHQFTAACRMVQDALDQEDPDLVNAWSRAQKTYFEQARACANDLGMTITSRCRLVVPEGAQKQEENPFLQLMEARRRA
jgi:putative phage terminase, small subunit, P27 family